MVEEVWQLSPEIISNNISTLQATKQSHITTKIQNINTKTKYHTIRYVKSTTIYITEILSTIYITEILSNTIQSDMLKIQPFI